MRLEAQMASMKLRRRTKFEAIPYKRTQSVQSAMKVQLKTP